MEKTKLRLNGTVRKIVILSALAVGIYLAFRYLLPLVIPFVIAGIVSVLYYPLLRRLYEKTGMWNGKKKRWFLVAAVLLFYLVLFLLVGLFAGYLLGQGQSILLNLPFYQAKAVYLVKNCCGQVDEILHMANGASFAYIEGIVGGVWSDPLNGMLPKVTSYSVQMAGKLFHFLFCAIITIIATFFMIQDYDGIRAKLLESEIGSGMCRVLAKCKDTFKAYIRAQGLILLLDGILCTAAFLIIDQPYALVFGPLTAVVDALPVLGAGLVLWPYILVLVLTKHLWQAGVLLLAYLGCLLIRQLTEPRLVGGEVGIKPLYTIISMYAGVRLFGIYGFFLGPVGVLIGKELYIMILANAEE